MQSLPPPHTHSTSKKVAVKRIWKLITINIGRDIELSVYITSFSAEIGFVSFNLEAINMHAAPKSCSLVLGVSQTDKNLSK